MKKRGFSLAAIFLGLFLISLVQANSPPILKQEIPIVSFENGSLLSDFDLDEYFYDPDGDELTYTYSGTISVGVAIDDNNTVSFLAPNMGSKEESVYFIATDGEYTLKSNQVKIYVGTDKLKPEWENLTKSKNEVYPGDFVEFSAHWTDDRQLSNFEFYIYQESPEYDEVNWSWTIFKSNMSGKEDFSNVKTKIIVGRGMKIQWYFCAYDTWGNKECTPEKAFAVSAAPAGTDSADYVLGSDTEKFDSYILDKDKIFIELMQGTSLTKVINVMNTGEEFLDFNFSIEGLDDLAVLSTVGFGMQPETTREISIEFSAEKDLMPGAYNGNLLINSEINQKVPILIYVNSLLFDYEVDVNCTESTLKRGQNVTAKIYVNNKKGNVVNQLNLTYAIKDFEGNIYSQGSEEITVGKDFSTEAMLSLPEDLEPGYYVFHSKISGEDYSAIGSDFITVRGSYNIKEILKTSSKYLAALVILVILIWLYVRHRLKEKRIEALNLYVRFEEMKKAIDEKDFRKAAEIYTSLKSRYREPVAEDQVENKDELIKRIEELSKTINLEDAAPAKGEDADKKTPEKPADGKEVPKPEEKKDTPESASAKPVTPKPATTPAKPEEKKTTAPAPAPAPKQVDKQPEKKPETTKDDKKQA